MAAAASCTLLAGRLPPTTHTIALTGAAIAAPLVLQSALHGRQLIMCQLDAEEGLCSITSIGRDVAQKATHFRCQSASLAATTDTHHAADGQHPTALMR